MSDLADLADVAHYALSTMLPEEMAELGYAPARCEELKQAAENIARSEVQEYVSPMRYNGFEPNEVKTSPMVVRSTEDHLAVETRVHRVGDSMNFRYTLVCKCGKKFNSKASMTQAGYALDRHARKEGQQ